MNIEDIRNEFPATPDSVKRIIADTVYEQTQAEPEQIRHPISMRRIVLVGLAAVMVLALSVTAGAEYIRRFRSEVIGRYGMELTVSNDETETADVSEIEGRVYPDYQVSLGWIPEGTTAENVGGTHVSVYKDEDIVMWVNVKDFDPGDGIHVSEVAAKEEFELNGHEAIYYEMGRPFSGKTSKTVMIYYAVERCIVSVETNLFDKETVLKAAESVTVSHIHGSDHYIVNWSEIPDVETYTTVSDSDMANTHSIGESFNAGFIYARGVAVDLEATVTDVEISADNSVLDTDLLSNSAKRMFDDDGQIKPTEVRYIMTGDGINTLSETVYAEEAARKVVTVTMEIKNTTDRTLEDIKYYPTMIYLEKTDGGYAVPEICLTDTVRTAPNGESYNAVDEIDRYSLSQAEPLYCVTEGEERDEDHPYNIYELAPGETAIVHVAYAVIEDMVPNLYLRAGGVSNLGVMPTNVGLAEGYVKVS